MGWSFQLVFLPLLVFQSVSCANLCSHDETSSLLNFKQLFSRPFFLPSLSFSIVYCFPHPKMNYWKEDSDCCSWEGVTCDMVTGHVIGLDLSCSGLSGNFPSNSSLFLLSHLQKLNLAFNDFNHSQIPSNFFQLKSLTHLNLSCSGFRGPIPLEISHLSKLVSLDLSSEISYLSGLSSIFSTEIPVSKTYVFGLSLETSVMKGVVQNMTDLEELVLHGVNMSTIDPAYLTNLSSSLTLLNLRECGLQGSFPESIFQLPNLQKVNLNGNNALTGYFAMVNWSSTLRYLDLSSTNSSGKLPYSIENLKSLWHLDISGCKFMGIIPKSIGNLSQLLYLDLSYNYLSGTVEISMFAELKNLEKLDLSGNSLSVLTTTNKFNNSFPHLTDLALSFCSINEFPNILSTANNLRYLDLSNNKIHGQIPNWLYKISLLASLDLSLNYLTGIEQLPWMEVRFLDLHSNLVQGQLPAPPPSVQFFIVADNNMTGAIPSSFCNLTSVLYLDLSTNNLYGSVPQCLLNYTSIEVLNLRMNNFHGSIPQTFANSSQPLTALDLNGNKLEGPLPPSLVNYPFLTILDVGNNMINDTFPHWLATLPKLQVLILRSNRFHGSLGNPKTRLPFPKLRILDLSHNNFTGHLQTGFFQNFQAMMSWETNGAKLRYIGRHYYYEVSIVVTMKGVEITMERILTIFTTMDLSNNKFQGQIPDVVGKLKSLKALNFSHNNLTGHISISLENLTELESLDLSSNKLHGEIPMQLTSLTSLSTLNLSYNQLEGPIPSGKQFNTFENNSYIGNLRLCGFPLSKKCSNDEAPTLEPTKFHEEHDSSRWFDWKFIMMGYGSGLVIGLSMGYIVFSTGKPWWFVSMVERKVLKLARQNKGRTRRRN